MSRPSQTAVLFLMLAGAAFAQDSNSAVAKEIHAMEEQWNTARVHADVATLGRILSDDWTVTHGDGTTDTKAKYLADLKSGARTFSGSVSEHDVTILTSAAVVAGGLYHSAADGPLRKRFAEAGGRIGHQTGWRMEDDRPQATTRRQP
jgi:hypothetical protein